MFITITEYVITYLIIGFFTLFSINLHHILSFNRNIKNQRQSIRQSFLRSAIWSFIFPFICAILLHDYFVSQRKKKAQNSLYISQTGETYNYDELCRIHYIEDYGPDEEFSRFGFINREKMMLKYAKENKYAMKEKDNS